jgi:hypothetical protein
MALWVLGREHHLETYRANYRGNVVTARVNDAADERMFMCYHDLIYWESVELFDSQKSLVSLDKLQVDEIVIAHEHSFVSSIIHPSRNDITAIVSTISLQMMFSSKHPQGHFNGPWPTGCVFIGFRENKFSWHLTQFLGFSEHKWTTSVANTTRSLFKKEKQFVRSLFLRYGIEASFSQTEKESVSRV